jgi:hypothetical protein
MKPSWRHQVEDALLAGRFVTITHCAPTDLQSDEDLPCGRKYPPDLAQSACLLSGREMMERSDRHHAIKAGTTHWQRARVCMHDR